MTDQPTTGADHARLPEGPAPAGPIPAPAAPRPPGSGRRRTFVGVAATLALTAGATAAACTSQGATAGPPQPDAVASAPAAAPVRPSPSGAPPQTSAAATVMPASVPVSLDIPAIKVHTRLLKLGQNTDGTVQVPWQPLKAGWYKNSPTPGQLGASVTFGHVDSQQTGPAVFYRLGALTPAPTSPSPAPTAPPPSSPPTPSTDTPRTTSPPWISAPTPQTSPNCA